MTDSFIATINFRWLIKENGERVLQQLFVDSRFPFSTLSGFMEWRDVPEAKETQE